MTISPQEHRHACNGEIRRSSTDGPTGGEIVTEWCEQCGCFREYDHNYCERRREPFMVPQWALHMFGGICT